MEQQRGRRGAPEPANNCPAHKATPVEKKGEIGDRLTARKNVGRANHPDR